MKKKNKNGFFLSETMVVMAVVAVVLLGVFKIFSSVYTRYKESENYNTINATSALSTIKEYFESINFNTVALLGDEYYADLTNHSDYQSVYYIELKDKLNIEEIYLIDFSRIFEGNNINVFNTSLRKYLKKVQDNRNSLKLVTVVNGNEYANIDIKPSTPPTLVGNAEDEYLIVVAKDGTFEEPGYLNWKGDPPITEWETPFNSSVEGTYYLKYSFDGYVIKRKVIVTNTVVEYNYTGQYQEYVVPASGWYQIEAWGAKGGNGLRNAVETYAAGAGGYTSGYIDLDKDEILYLYVGGAGEVPLTGANGLGGRGGYNGGGLGGTDSDAAASANEPGGGGGGATDIRYGGQKLNDRIMVAGGGGGSAYSGIGGTGGGIVSGIGASGGSNPATQKVGNSFGIGQRGAPETGGYGGGGGGYWGGYTGKANYYGGSGGSSYISGYAGVNSITSATDRTLSNTVCHYSGKYFINGKMEEGVNEGDGRVRITFIGSEKPPRSNATLKNVQYVKDCATGNATNGVIYWSELQVIVDGVNVAYGLEATGTVVQHATYPYARITDGNAATDSASHSRTNGNTQNVDRCIQIDLGQVYPNVDEIAVWHLGLPYYTGYSHTNNITQVSETGEEDDWVTVIGITKEEDSTGKRTNAWD